MKRFEDIGQRVSSMSEIFQLMGWRAPKTLDKILSIMIEDLKAQNAVNC
ncbi:MAG TPA: hypothetical protein VL171_08805 [Verrucomicrobiae bacterium]|nr:hypothetical protein [Verrucomicrobiae bacterium]